MNIYTVVSNDYELCIRDDTRAVNLRDVSVDLQRERERECMSWDLSQDPPNGYTPYRKGNWLAL